MFSKNNSKFSHSNLKQLIFIDSGSLTLLKRESIQLLTPLCNFLTTKQFLNPLVSASCLFLQRKHIISKPNIRAKMNNTPTLEQQVKGLMLNTICSKRIPGAMDLMESSTLMIQHLNMERLGLHHVLFLLRLILMRTGLNFGQMENRMAKLKEFSFKVQMYIFVSQFIFMGNHGP